MILGTSRALRVYAYPEAVDLRNGYDGLFGLVKQALTMQFLPTRSAAWPRFDGGKARSRRAAPVLPLLAMRLGGTSMFLRRQSPMAPSLRQLEPNTTGAHNARRDVLALPNGAVTNDDYAFALTSDALGVIYTARDGEMYYASRPSVSVPFAHALKVRIPNLESPGYATYARSITRDGCELYLSSNRDNARSAHGWHCGSDHLEGQSRW